MRDAGADWQETGYRHALLPFTAHIIPILQFGKDEVTADLGNGDRSPNMRASKQTGTGRALANGTISSWQISSSFIIIDMKITTGKFKKTWK